LPKLFWSGVAVGVLGLVLVVVTPWKLRGGVVMSLGLVWCVLNALGALHCSSLKRALAEGRVSVVEGTVDRFEPMPYEGHRNERFSVNGVTFSYSDYSQDPGFHQSMSHGGPIREGLPVRISYVDKTIVKLEVRRR